MPEQQKKTYIDTYKLVIAAMSDSDRRLFLKRILRTRRPEIVFSYNCVCVAVKRSVVRDYLKGLEA